MPEQSYCWVCRRTEAEVSAFADVETPWEKEIQQQTSQFSRLRAEFAESADVWRKGVPKEYKEFDFKFVVSNPDQFKSIRIANGLLGEIAAPNKLLGEIADAKKQTADWLDSVAITMRNGEGELPGFGVLSHFEKADRDQLRRMVSQFEEKWRRRIGSDGTEGEEPNGYKSGFDGLKLFEGLEFMVAEGALYYDLQAQLLDMARRKDISNKTRKQFSLLTMSGYPPLPLCSVCVDIMKEISSRRFEVEPAVPKQVTAGMPRRS